MGTADHTAVRTAVQMAQCPVVGTGVSNSMRSWLQDKGRQPVGAAGHEVRRPLEAAEREGEVGGGQISRRRVFRAD